MTPEQLREEAAAIERMHGETLTVEWRLHMAELLRAHAAALEEIERLNAAWKAQQFHLEAEERESAHWQERAEQAERRAERLKGLLRSLHALVWGECPSLLNEDSGGSSHLDADIRAEIKGE